MAQKSVYATIVKSVKNELCVDDIICNVLGVACNKGNIARAVSLKEMRQLLDAARVVFTAQGSMVEVEAPINICGDVHGQFADVLRLLDRGRFPPISNYLFLGDYVDRGPQSLETITLFLAYKVKYPKNFFLLRGNHETAAVNQVYGFFDEVCRRYNREGVELWNTFQTVFAYMPYTGLVSGRILCMHGGISERMESLDQLRRLPRPVLEIGAGTLEIDLLWSDPDEAISYFEDSTRGIGQVFGEKALNETVRRLGIDLVARAHQVVQDGYEFFANKKLVTIFSAPHYCGSFNNAAAMMIVDKNLSCSFQIMRPVIS